MHTAPRGLTEIPTPSILAPLDLAAWACQKGGLTKNSERLCPFANHYQFFREVLFDLENDGVFVLLSDDRSPVFFQYGPQGARGPLHFLMQFIPETLHERVSQVSIQELLVELESSSDQAWILEFRAKIPGLWLFRDKVEEK
jgi:hypothetical protein